MSERKKRIGIDLDDVLFELNDVLMAFHNGQYGTNYNREHLTTWNLSPVWGCDDEEVTRRLFEFYESDLHHTALPSIGAREFIDRVKDNNEVFIITARPDKFKDVTLAWVNKHFPNIFKDVLFANHHDKDGGSIKKSEFCKQHQIDLFIDDALHNVNDTAEQGIETLLFDQPWNRDGYVHPNVRRVFSWEEIEVG